MENLIQKLKSLKNISPDPGYIRRSRSLIVESLFVQRPITSPWQILTNSLQFGSAIALTGVLLVLILVGFSAWKFVSPLRLGSLDPASLKAEAEAIDLQIHLSDINYAEPENQTSTLKMAAPMKAGQIKVSDASSSEPLSLDDVLDRLAQ